MKHNFNNLASHLLLVWEAMRGKGGMDSVGQDNPKVQQTLNNDALQGFSPTEMNTSIKKETEDKICTTHLGCDFINQIPIQNKSLLS